MAIFSKVKGQRKWNGGTVRFLIIFFSCLSVFAIAYLFLRSSAAFVPILDFNAMAASSTLNLFGASTYANGAIVSSSDFTFRVTPECTSIIFTGIFISIVLAWPSKIREKLIGIAIGIAVLLFLNLVRLITLFYIGSAFPDFLDIAHFFLWQILMILLTIGLWLLWSAKIVRTPREGEKRDSS